MQLLNPQTPWDISIRYAILDLVTWAKLDRLAVTAASALGFTEKKAPIPSLIIPGRQLNENVLPTYSKSNIYVVLLRSYK